MKQTDRQKAGEISTINYPSRTEGEFRQAVYRLLARQEASYKISKFEKATKFYEESAGECNHAGAINAVGNYKDKQIRGLICNTCAV